MRCNRCVKDFDHHCKWVNNCVGKSNYKLFIALLFAAASLSLVTLAESCLCLHTAFTDYELFSTEVSARYGEAAAILLGVLVFTALQSGVVLFLLVYLLGFHLWLARQNLTTFEYILQRGPREKRVSVERKAIFADVNSPQQIVLDDSPDEHLPKDERSTFIQA